jgi:hypothetical protein
MSLLDTAPGLWDPTTGRVYTFMIPGPDPTGPLVSAWGRETHAELIATGTVSPESVILSHDEALALQEAAERQRLCTGPQLITPERFEELLNCLPPQLWTRLDSTESFRISEPLCGDLWTWCVRIGPEHYTITERGTISHTELCRLCLQ